MTALARKLQSRGDEVRVIGVPDIEPAVRAANLAFESYCEEEYPAGSVARLYGPIAKLHGLDLMRYQVEEISPKLLQAELKHLSQKLVETGVEALVFDALTFLQLVPMSMGIPFIEVWNTLHVDFSGATPPTLFGWPHETTAEARARNIEGVKIIGNLWKPIWAVAQAYAKQNGLQIDWSDPSATTSKLAVITQTPREFDFAGTPWPAHFHYTGPFHESDGREQVAFPWEKLTGEPLIYASLGSLVNGRPEIFRSILGAVEKLKGIQAVLSVGRNVNLGDPGPIPANTLVVNTAPQIALLKHAVLCITHAGLNTTLESLAQGVPMVAIPIGYDQPGVAARIAHHGVGEFMEVEHLTAEALSERIQGVLSDPRYRIRAQHFASAMAETRGLDA
jgi:MGT family glycosyltransferase